MLNNLKKAFSNSFIYSIGRLSTKIVGLVLIPIYTEKLTTVDYGMLGILEITSELLIALFSLTLYSAFVRLYWEQEFIDKQKEMYFTYMMSLLVLGILMYLGFQPFVAYFSKALLGASNNLSLIQLMLISTALRIIVRSPSTLMRSQEKPVLFTITNISRLVVTLVLTVYFIIYRGHKIEAIFEAQIIGQLFYLIVLLKYILQNNRLKFDFIILKEMLNYSLPLVFSSISGVLLTLGDRYCLRILAQFSELGVYNLGFKLANVLKVFFISSIQLAIPPMVYKMIDQPNSKRFYSKIMTYTSFTLIILILIVTLYSKEIIRVIAASSSYWEAYKVVPYLSFSSLFLMLMYTSSIGLNIMKKTKVMARIVIIISVLNILLNFAFIPSLRIVGASLATLISRILHFVIIYYVTQKIYKIPYELKKICLMITVAVIIVIAGMMVNDLNLAIRLTVKTLMIISFPLVLYLFHFYEEIELLRIKQTWQKWRDPRNWKKNTRSFNVKKEEKEPDPES
ncbi:oligosaccharide flippase family protein [Candidatus Cloacimonadota bacterium]